MIGSRYQNATDEAVARIEELRLQHDLPAWRDRDRRDFLATAQQDLRWVLQQRARPFVWLAAILTAALTIALGVLVLLALNINGRREPWSALFGVGMLALWGWLTTLAEKRIHARIEARYASYLA